MEDYILQVTSKSIESSGLPQDFKDAIAEYIWNGFDAKASKIEINYLANDLGYFDHLVIKDNGTGINLETIDQTFGYFLDSQKQSTFDSEGYIKGKIGKGRFSFSLFALNAKWDTIYRTKEGKLFEYQIIIDKKSQNKFSINNKKISKAKSTGTTVVLSEIFKLTSDLLESGEFNSYLQSEFGWFLFLNREKDFQILINGESINYLGIIAEHEEFQNNEGDFTFNINFIRWSCKIGEKYFYHFLNSENKEVGRKHTSFNNKAIDFHHSVYIVSDYFNSFKLTKEDVGVLELDGKNQTDHTFRHLITILNKYLFEKEKSFIKEQQANKLIENYYANGIFPRFKQNSYEIQRKKDLESVVKEIYCVQPKIFQGLRKEQSKTLVGFLNLLLDTDEREKVLEIIEGIIQLSEEERNELTKTLKKTNFSKIIKTIKLLETRFEVVQILKTLVFDLEKYTKERGQLQEIVQDNFWIFGEQYHLVSADENFEIALNNYLHYFENGKKNELHKMDLKEKIKRPDIFLCRFIDVNDKGNTDYFIKENIIVELKRPSIEIGKTQYSQVEDYMRVIINEPRFNSQLREWKFYIVGKSVDEFIKDKYDSQKSKGKKFLVESVKNYDIYALTWDDIFRCFEVKHMNILNSLEFKDSILDDFKSKGILYNAKTPEKLVDLAAEKNSKIK